MPTQLRRQITSITVNADEYSDVSDDSDETDFFRDESDCDDDEDLNMEEKLLQREIIKNFIAIKKAKTSAHLRYDGDLSRSSTFKSARISTAVRDSEL